MEEEHDKLASLASLATLVMPGDTTMTGKRCATAACGVCALSTAQSSVCCCCCCRRRSSRHPSHDEPQASKPKHGDQARQARQIAVNFVQNPGSYATTPQPQLPEAVRHCAAVCCCKGSGGGRGAGRRSEAKTRSNWRSVMTQIATKYVADPHKYGDGSGYGGR